MSSYPDGAGDDVVEDTFWVNVVRRQERSWIIAPTGRTEWVRLVDFPPSRYAYLPWQGLDWHGPSASEAFATHQALSKILDVRYRSWSYDSSGKSDPRRPFKRRAGRMVSRIEIS